MKKKKPRTPSKDQLQKASELIHASLVSKLPAEKKDIPYSPTPRTPKPDTFYIDDLADLSEKTEEEIITENADFLMPFFDAKDAEGILASKYRYRIEGLALAWHETEPLESAEDHKRWLKMSRIYHLLQIARHRNEGSLYRLGSERESLLRIQNQLENFDFQTDFRHSMKGTQVAKKQHAEAKKQYPEAVDLAEQMWVDGDKRNRPQMVSYLKEKYPKLGKKELQKQLTPLAEKYGRMFDPKAERPQRKVHPHVEALPQETPVAYIQVHSVCDNCGRRKLLIEEQEGRLVDINEIPRVGKCECKRNKYVYRIETDNIEETKKTFADLLCDIEEYNENL